MYKLSLYRPEKPKLAWTERVETPRQLEQHKKYVIGKHTTFVQEITVRNYLAEDIILDRDSLKKEKKTNCIIL